jgi:N-glycosidase YbiA
MTIYFYSDREQPYGCFSNFSAHGFVLDDSYWPTSEHYFQAQKFVGTARVEQIRGLNKPKEAANMGRDRNGKERSDWETVKDEVMRQAVLAKFRTHGEIRAILLGTGDEDLVENAPGDYYWGCGQDGTGQNKLGLILMEVRQGLCGWS